MESDIRLAPYSKPTVNFLQGYFFSKLLVKGIAFVVCGIVFSLLAASLIGAAALTIATAVGLTYFFGKKILKNRNKKLAKELLDDEEAVKENLEKENSRESEYYDLIYQHLKAGSFKDIGREAEAINKYISEIKKDRKKGDKKLINDDELNKNIDDILSTISKRSLKLKEVESTIETISAILKFKEINGVSDIVKKKVDEFRHSLLSKKVKIKREKPKNVWGKFRNLFKRSKTESLKNILESNYSSKSEVIDILNYDSSEKTTSVKVDKQKENSRTISKPQVITFYKSKLEKPQVIG